MGYRRLAMVIIVVSLMLLAGVSCENPASANKPAPSTTGSVAAQVHEPIVSRWPTGLKAAIVRQSDGIVAIDENGLRFKIAFLDSVGPAKDALAAASYADLETTDNGQYLAYRFWGGDVILCSTADGSIKGSAPAELHDEIVAVSSDGRYAFLVDRGKEPGIWGPEMHASQRVSIADTSTGERLKVDAVQALVSGSEERLGLIRWSSRDQAFLLQVMSEPCAVYSYDPAHASLTKVPGIDALRGVSDAGLILGAVGSTLLEGGGIDFGQPVTFQGGDLLPVHGSPLWDYGEAISPDGSTLVFESPSGNDGDMVGWQVFRRNGDDWRSDPPVFTRPLNYAQLFGIGEDNRTVWGVRLAGSTRNDYQLVSLDTETGKWNEWFGSEDLKVAPGDFHLEIPLIR